MLRTTYNLYFHYTTVRLVTHFYLGIIKQNALPNFP